MPPVTPDRLDACGVRAGEYGATVWDRGIREQMRLGRPVLFDGLRGRISLVSLLVLSPDAGHLDLRIASLARERAVGGVAMRIILPEFLDCFPKAVRSAHHFLDTLNRHRRLMECLVER